MSAWRRLEAHLGSRDVTRILYGSIIGLALVVALQKHPPGAGQVAAAIIGTAVAVGLAEVYSEVVGREARTRRPAGWAGVREALGEAGPVMLGAGFPAIFFILAAAGAIDLDLAFTLSRWTGLGLICGYGYLAGRLSGSGPFAALLHAAAVGAIGGALIALKSIVH